MYLNEQKHWHFVNYRSYKVTIKRAGKKQAEQHLACTKHGLNCSLEGITDNNKQLHG